ncbi:MAG: RNA methyltransferase, partial [Thermus sp.]
MPVKVVLVEPEEPMNVGAVARAMKNFGLRVLALVNPGPRVGPPFPPEAFWLAVHAEDVLQGAVVYSSLMEAVAEARLVVATTGRPRELYPAPLRTPQEVAQEVLGVEGEV